MTIEECLKIIREELLQQSSRHDLAAETRILEYKRKQKPEILHEALRLAFTSEALRNFSNALTLETVQEWQSNCGK